jgi:DNA-binding SARP family transcriptional activator/tetratricopeptide (TPR) repeat protein
MLETRLLGQFSIRLDGDSVELASRPAQSLFAYLILQPGKQHRRERLAGLLWPDSTESSARNNLRQALYKIRRSLGQDGHQYIAADRFHANFNPDLGYWLDVEVFERELDPEEPLEQWLRVLDAYGGDLLPGFYDDWVVMERERLGVLHQRKMSTLIARIGSDLQAVVGRLEREAQWQLMLDWGERWIALGGIPEPAYRAIMLANFELGDSSGAVATYDRLKDSLWEEFTVRPSAETEQLLERIRAGERRVPSEGIEWEREPPAFLGIDAEEAAGPPFVAREAELAMLDRHLQAALQGNGQVAFVTGDAGSGKTALMLEFARRAHLRHQSLLIGRGNCSSLTGFGDPFLPFRDVLGCLVGDLETYWSTGALTTAEVQRSWQALPLSAGSLLHHGEDLIGGFVSLSWLAGVCRGHPEITPELVEEVQLHARLESLDGAGQDRQQAGMLRQYAETLRAISIDRPILLILDDLQWADTASADLLFHLSRGIGTSQILLIGCYRSEELQRRSDGRPHPLVKVIAELKRSKGRIEIDLTRSMGRQFVDALIDSEPNQLDPAFRESLHRQTGGHPLFTVELLRAMESRGDIVRDDRRTWITGPSLDWASLPARIGGVIEERIGGLRDDQLEILNVSSVEGESFTAEVVAQVIDRDEREVIQSLSQELDKRYKLVEAQGARHVNGQRLSAYRFRHTLFQRHLYDELDTVERPFLHEEVGNSLEALHGGQTGDIAVELAWHFAESGDALRAIRYLRQAGDRARRLSANDEAVTHLSAALEMLGNVPEVADRLEQELRIQLALGASLIGTKGYAAPEVEDAFARARELSQLIGETPHLFPAIWGLWSYNTLHASHATARELGQQLVQLAIGNHDFEIEARRALGTTLFYTGEVREAREQLERGVRIYAPELHGDHAYLYGQNPVVSCLSNLALSLWMLGSPRDALDKMDRALEVAEQTAHPHSLAYALLMATMLHSSIGQWHDTLHYADHAVAVAEKHGFPLWLTASTILRGAAMAQEGDSQGMQVIREGLDKWEQYGAVLGLPHYQALLAETLAADGQAEAGLEQIELALRFSAEHDERVHESELYRIRGDLLLQLGRPSAEVEDALKTSIRRARDMQLRSMELRSVISLCQLRFSQGRRQAPRDMLAKVYSRFDDGTDTPDLRAARRILQ